MLVPASTPDTIPYLAGCQAQEGKALSQEKEPQARELGPLWHVPVTSKHSLVVTPTH